MTSQKLHYLSSYAKGPSAGTRHQVATRTSQTRRTPEFDDDDDDVLMEDAPTQTVTEPSRSPHHSLSAPSLHRFDAVAATGTTGRSAVADLRRSSRLAVIPEAEEEEIITTSDVVYSSSNPAASYAPVTGTPEPLSTLADEPAGSNSGGAFAPIVDEGNMELDYEDAPQAGPSNIAGICTDSFLPSWSRSLSPLTPITVTPDDEQLHDSGRHSSQDGTSHTPDQSPMHASSSQSAAQHVHTESASEVCLSNCVCAYSY